jgi:hypothetical protein
MKKPDLFKRASEDGAYRCKMLDDARKSKKFAVSFLWVCSFLSVTSILLAVFGKMRWSAAAISSLPAAVVLLNYNLLRSLIAKLDAMSLKPNHPTEPTSPTGTSAAGHPPRQS